MRAKPREFTSLSVNLQQRLILLLTEKYSLRGEEAPVKKALQKIGEQRPQTRRSWQRVAFFTMQQIDKELRKNGMPAKHFPTKAERALI